MATRAVRRSRSNTEPSVPRSREEQHLVVIERLNRRQSPLDGGKVLERCQDPSPEPARPRGRACLVQDREEAELSAPVLQIGDQLEVALGSLVQLDEGPVRVDPQGAHVVQAPLRGVAEVFQEHSRGKDFRRALPQPISFQVCNAKLPFQSLPAGLGIEAPVRKPVDQETFPLPQQVPQDRVLHEQGFLGNHLAGLQPVKLAFQDLLTRIEGKRSCRKLPRGDVRVRQGHCVSRPGRLR